MIEINVLNSYQGKPYTAKTDQLLWTTPQLWLAEEHHLRGLASGRKSWGPWHVTHLTQFQAVLNFLQLVYLHRFWNSISDFQFLAINLNSQLHI